MKIIRKNLNVLLMALALLLTNTAWSQVVSISGKVTDSASGEPLPGVTVIVQGTTIGTITNFDGEYVLKVEKGATVLYSYIGYKPTEMVIGDQTTINIKLAVDTENLEEVVVIGYGQVKKSDATGSVVAVKSDDFNQGSSSSPQDLIVGKIAGVNITSEGGAPGSSTQIRIRGGSSMSASNDPLIIVDGMPLDNRTISGMSNILNSINPADIETFTVLKDASATAIYGSRASNGVILITTKKGTKGQDLRLNFDSKFSVSKIKETISVLNADEFRDLVNTRAVDHSSVNPDLMGSANTDWQNEIFKTAIGQDYNLGLSGSAATIPFRASVGYTNQDGILKTSNLERYTGSLNVNPDFLESHLKLSLGVKAMKINNRFADKGAIGNALRFDPTQPVKDDDPKYDRYGGYYTWLMSDGTRNVNGTRNPVAQLMQRADKSDVSRVIADFQANYKVHFLPELNVTVKGGIDYSSSDGTTVTDTLAAWTQASSVGVNRVYTQEKNNKLFNFILNYQKDLDEIDSRIEAMAGYEWQHFHITSSAVEWDRNDSEIENSKDATENYLVSFFGRLNYTFKDRYLLTATVRQDGSSRFHKDNRWGTFPSFAFAWRMKEEGFMQNMKELTNLKLRLGYGVTGQQELNSGDYPYLGTYTLSDNRTQYQFGDQYYTLIRPNGYDESLEWEETTTYNAGLDFGFFNNRLNGSIDVYKRKTKNLLNTIPVPAGTNFTDRLLTNVGDLENNGLEFSVNGIVVSKQDMNWELGFNLAYNKNEVTRLTNYDDPDYKGVEVGGISGVGVGNYIQINAVGHSLNTFYVYQQVYDTDGKPIEGLYVDRNNDGQITLDDKYYYKDPAPTVSMGFSSKFNYKNWDLGFSGRISLGNYVYNNVIVGARYQELTVNEYLTNMPSEIKYSQFETAQQYSDYFVKDASFLRMDNISLGYTFNKIIHDKVNLRLYSTVQNVFVITDYKGLDPEIPSGIDNDVYPRPRIFTFGLSANF